jgi:MoxR-like ATPase
LWRHGIIQASGSTGGGSIEWDSAFSVAPVIARMIACPDTGLPALFEPLDTQAHAMPAAHLVAGAARLRASASRKSLRVVPLAGASGADFEGTAATLGQLAGCKASRLHVTPNLRANAGQLRALLAAAWFREASVLLAVDACAHHGAETAAPHAYLNELRGLPITIFIATDESGALPGLAPDLRLPALEIPRITYQERATIWRHELRGEPGLPGPAIDDCARRFRFEPLTIRAAAAWMREAPARDERTLVEACRVTAPLEVGGLAERVIPRFCAGDLVLAPPQRRQFDEIARAMEALGDVHYRWGTARAWNESGLSILLCGPPGCGKNTFAEALADRLDLPMYRIDLSQVANKYVGETEKNLKRLFDAGDVADAILFFDEADAVFGKRMDVRDAHDRYANLEVSYLLARMERFKGLAILATNRRKDLDEAFLRRLRAVVELPLPESAQRAQIWRSALPPGVDGSALDFDFLGRSFNIAGGHIRSAMFNACLQSAAGQRGAACPRLTMEAVIAALKRELEKLRRSPSPAQFGAFAELAKELDRG